MDLDTVMMQIYGQIDGVKWFTLADSQYSSGITNSACTVLATEATSVLQRVPYIPMGSIPSEVLNKIMQDGSAEYYNLQAAVGGPAHKSVEEVLIMPRLGSVLRVATHRQEFIRQGVFAELLDSLCSEMPGDPWGAVVTKFAVAVCVVHRDGDFIVFDSHGIHPATKGFGSLLCFGSSGACGDHLQSIFPATQGRETFPLVQQLQMDSFDFVVLLSKASKDTVADAATASNGSSIQSASTEAGSVAQASPNTDSVDGGGAESSTGSETALADMAVSSVDTAENNSDSVVQLPTTADCESESNGVSSPSAVQNGSDRTQPASADGVDLEALAAQLIGDMDGT